MKKNTITLVALSIMFLQCATAQKENSNLSETVAEFVAARCDDLEASANYNYLTTRERTALAQQALQAEVDKAGLVIDGLPEKQRKMLEKELAAFVYLQQLEQNNVFERMVKMEKGNASGEDGIYGKLTLQEIKLLMKEKARGLQTMLALCCSSK